MTVSIAVVCEGPADFPLVTCLAERVILEHPPWLDGLMADAIHWRGETAAEPCLPWQHVRSRARDRAGSIRVPLGKFAGERGAPDAATARRALRLLRASPDRPDAILLLRDADNHPTRLLGLNQARGEVEQQSPLDYGPIVIGVAHSKRECWVLHGFEPRNDREGDRLAQLTRELRFDPVAEPHRLNDRHDHEPRSAKRVLSTLVAGDRDRECACWSETSLTLLRRRGGDTGLTSFLDEVAARLVPLFAHLHP